MTQKQKNIIIVAVVLVGGLALITFKGNIFQSADINSASFPSENSRTAVQKEQPLREIDIKAFKFGYEPNVINVKKGEKVKINIENADVVHGIRIPDLGLSGDDSLEFTANRAGEFIWYCNNFCGEGHRDMQGKLVIEDSVAQNTNQYLAQPLNKREQVFFGEKGEALTLENSKAEIPAAVFESQKARFYNAVLANGKTIYFFVVKDKDGKYRAAANACQVCFQQKKGFRQEGNEMVCNNCGNRYPMEKIALEKGGCNPAPISADLQVKNNKIIINQEELGQVAGLF